MPLLNYTTTVSVDRSVQQIQKALIKAGASSFLQDFDDKGAIEAVSFSISLPHPDIQGQFIPISYRLPADWRKVLRKLQIEKVPQRYANPDQARRVAWRIIKDWVEAQMAIVETEMVTLPQVFLPYAVDSMGTTLYENIAANPKLFLGGGNE